MTTEIITFYGRCVSRVGNSKFYGQLGLVRAVKDGVVSEVLFDNIEKLRKIPVTFDRHDFVEAPGAIRYTTPEGLTRVSAPPDEHHSELLLIAQEKMENGKWVKVVA